MTVEIVQGDITKCDEDIIAHQTNCQGGAGGLASALLPRGSKALEEYEEYCKQFKDDMKSLFGTVQYVKNNGKIIANCFGQIYGGSNFSPYNSQFFKNPNEVYSGLQSALSIVERDAREKNLSVAIPYNIGCGIAGGDWNIVSRIINNIFEASPVKCVLYKFN